MIMTNNHFLDIDIQTYVFNAGLFGKVHNIVSCGIGSWDLHSCLMAFVCSNMLCTLDICDKDDIWPF